MKSKLVAESAGQRTFVVVLDSGEEAFGSLTTFAAKEQILGSSLTKALSGRPLRCSKLLLIFGAPSGQISALP
jgi:hypothetical protein